MPRFVLAYSLLSLSLSLFLSLHYSLSLNLFVCLLFSGLWPTLMSPFPLFLYVFSWYVSPQTVTLFLSLCLSFIYRSFLSMRYHLFRLVIITKPRSLKKWLAPFLYLDCQGRVRDFKVVLAINCLELHLIIAYSLVKVGVGGQNLSAPTLYPPLLTVTNGPNKGDRLQA